jgi:hypothetical protein
VGCLGCGQASLLPAQVEYSTVWRENHLKSYMSSGLAAVAASVHCFAA